MKVLPLVKTALVSGVSLFRYDVLENGISLANIVSAEDYVSCFVTRTGEKYMLHTFFKSDSTQPDTACHQILAAHGLYAIAVREGMHLQILHT